MSARATNGFASEANGSRVAATRNGKRGSARLGFGGGAPADSDGKSRYRTPEQERPLEITPEILDAERATLLREKQRGLDRIVDKHDDLVREMFHMENFVNMLLYDPKVAKEDRTAVFKEYKSRYDLVDNTIAVAGSSRQTRGRHNERRQILQNTAVSAPSGPPAKRKSKPKDGGVLDLQDILSSAKNNMGKGKGKAAALESAHELPVAQIVPPPVGSISVPIMEDTIVVQRKPKHKDHAPETPPMIVASTLDDREMLSTIIHCPEDSISAPRPPRRKTNGNSHTSSMKRTAPVPIDVLEQTEKLNVVAPTHAPIVTSTCPPPLPQPSDDLISTGPNRRSGRLREPLAAISAPERSPKPLIRLKVRAPADVVPITPAPLPVSEHAPPQSPAKFSVKRIKLIVRRPPPSLTNPKQRVPPPKYNRSLTRFLASYVALTEEEDAQVSTLQQEIKTEADIRERVERFRVQGRFIPGTDVLFGTAPHDIPYTSPTRTTRDIWDDIVQGVIAKGRTRPKRSPAKQITAQIASRIQAHFDGQESKKVKAREAEERRLRNLAKSTMKLVIAEWKKAVYHIREKQRLEAKAEEQRLGRIHLDAILDQSGQILETQQGDLTRGELYGSRSRSGSVGDFLEDAEDDDDEDEDDDGDDEEEGGGEGEQEEDEEGDGTETSRRLYSIHDEEEDDDELEDETTSMLLDLPGNADSQLTTQISSSPGTGSSTPANASSKGLGRLKDDPEVSPVRLVNDGGALRELLMYDDSTSETDLEDLIHHDYGSSPQRSQPPQLPSSVESIDVRMAGLASAEPLSESMNEIQCDPEISAADPTLETHASPDENSSSNRNSAEAELDDALEETSNDHEGHQNQEDVISLEYADTQMDVVEEQVENRNEVPAEGMQDVVIEEQTDAQEDDVSDKEIDLEIPEYLKPYAVAPVQWDPESKVTPPLLLRGVLRPYQQSGLEWLASLHLNRLNGILADEMGLGKTIQTIALLAHLACDRGIWGPHLIVVPTSVLLNWEMEFKKFLPGFRVLSYHGSTKRRKELRQGWNDKHHFNVCITSYTLASRDAHIFKRKAWYYMILDEAHMIKNFKSQRWNILLMFRSYRRLLLTGTPLQNNLTELWALLQFLMSGSHFANLKEFGEWFSNPLERAIEMGNAYDDETMQRVSKLHTVLRPYLLRRLKRDVEKELPSKFDHLTLCPLSKRQRFLYDEFMSRAQTRDALDSGVYQKIANILMQLRKVCNHPDLFEVRPIVTSFAMPRSAIANFEIQELLVRRRMFSDEDSVNLDVIGLRFIDRQSVSLLSAVETRRLDSTSTLSHFSETMGEPPLKDTRTVAGYRKYLAYKQRASAVARWAHTGYLNKLRCSRIPIYSDECISVVRRMSTAIVPFSDAVSPRNYLDTVDHVSKAVKSYATRSQEMATLVDHFAFITPPVVALDMPHIALKGHEDTILQQPVDFDAVLHRASVKMQIAFPDPSLLQYDCGKMQKLASLLREKKAGGHRVLIFTQMTRILDILEIFLNFHGYLYLRLDGATKIEDRQYITERFNADARIFCFIASSRSGGVGINLTGADTVIFYDSDFNPQMDRQCEDRAHRIGQIRDVHIYRFVSQYTVEEAMLLKANQKRSLDDLVIQKGEFDWRSLFNDEGALTKALGDFEDAEDRHAAAVAAREEFSLVGADEADFGGDAEGGVVAPGVRTSAIVGNGHDDPSDIGMAGAEDEGGVDDDDDEQGGSVVEYMLAIVEEDYDYFRDWRL